MRISSNADENASLKSPAELHSQSGHRNLLRTGSSIQKITSRSQSDGIHCRKKQEPATAFCHRSTWIPRYIPVPRATETMRQKVSENEWNPYFRRTVCSASQKSHASSKINTIATHSSRFQALERSSSFLINLIEYDELPAYGQTWETVRLYDILRSNTERRRRIALSLSQIKDDAVRGLLANARSSRQQELDDLLVHGGVPQVHRHTGVVVEGYRKNNQRFSKTSQFGDSFSAILAIGGVPLASSQNRYRPGISRMVTENFPLQTPRHIGSPTAWDCSHKTSPGRSVSGRKSASRYRDTVPYHSSPLRVSSFQSRDSRPSPWEAFKYPQIPHDELLENFNRHAVDTHRSQVQQIQHYRPPVYNETNSCRSVHRLKDNFPPFIRPVQHKHNAGEGFDKVGPTTVKRACSPISSARAESAPVSPRQNSVHSICHASYGNRRLSDAPTTVTGTCDNSSFSKRLKAVFRKGLK